MAAEIKYRINTSKEEWLTDNIYQWDIGKGGGSMLWVDVFANGDIKVNEQKNEDWCRFFGRDDKGEFYRYWFTFISNSGYERRNEYEFSTTVDGEIASFVLKIKQKGELATPTVSENFNRIIQAKNDIKTAIENKGVFVGDVTIDHYADKIASIPQEVNSNKVILPNKTKFSGSTDTFIDTAAMDASNITQMGNMFSYCINLTSLDVSNWDTSNVTDMRSMFYTCQNLTSVGDLSNWVTSNVTNMRTMFEGCYNLTSVGDLSKWDTSKVVDMYGMFGTCQNLTSVGDLSKWDTSMVTNMYGMFGGCNNLMSLDTISSWDTSKVTSMGNMFAVCYKLITLDLSNWDTSNVTDMSNMFDNCRYLTELKMGGSVNNVNNVKEMFHRISTTGTLYYNKDYDYSKIIAVLPSTWTAVPTQF